MPASLKVVGASCSFKYDDSSTEAAAIAAASVKNTLAAVEVPGGRRS
jgi:hypothetical protein